MANPSPLAHRHIGPLSILLVVLHTLAFSQPFPQAHAHNDYEHDRPLFDALRFGFTSVEADIYLIDGKLLVSHIRPIFKSKTLEQLYLTPLDSILTVNHGKVFPGFEGPFYLMIDLKSDGDPTYDALKKVLAHYPALCRSKGKPGPVIIFLSGNRPTKSVLNDIASPVALDGRPEDVGKGYEVSVMPVISDTYRKWSDWNGKGPPDPGALQRIRELAKSVHAEGKKLRLWAIPDNETAWKELLKAGVDIINTDKLKELNTFLMSSNH